MREARAAGKIAYFSHTKLIVRDRGEASRPAAGEGSKQPPPPQSDTSVGASSVAGGQAVTMTPVSASGTPSGSVAGRNVDAAESTSSSPVAGRGVALSSTRAPSGHDTAARPMTGVRSSSRTKGHKQSR